MVYRLSLSEGRATLKMEEKCCHLPATTADSNLEPGDIMLEIGAALPIYYYT